MEPTDQNKNDEQRPPDARPQGAEATSRGGPEAAPRTACTDDPAVTSGPANASQGTRYPDGTLVIETNRIRGPNQEYSPNFVMVPVEIERPAQGGSGSGGQGERGSKQDKGDSGQEKNGKQDSKSQKGQGGDAQKNSSKSKQDEDDDQDKSGNQKNGASKWTHSPSMTKILLYAGIVSLVCGIAGAWGYSYFFGSGESDSQNSSGSGGGGDSGSSKGSSGGSSSGGSSGSSGGAGSKPSSGSSGSSKGSSDSSDSSQQNGDTGRLLEAESAWLTAMRDLRHAKAAEKAARRAEEDTKAVINFLEKTLFIAGRPGDVSLAEAFWTRGQGKDVMLRKAVDLSESRVGEAFTDRPLAEAKVREMLGLAYLSLGDPPQAVKQYERAYALREATQGVNDPETADCRNQLAVAYRLANRTDEAGHLFDRNAGSPGHSSALAVTGSMLLFENKPAEAERKLRESLTIRQRTKPNDWSTFDTKSLLGQALMDQGKFAEAEPLLLAGYEGLKQHQDMIPAQDRPHFTKALERLVKLYEAWGRKDQAMKWRNELEAEG